ncbi:unnamed protein product [Adineta ricciae]|uniref:Uncharacterized protein n=1 Tax=Adineta ricciae TaxID=249248 RepID=A0A815W6Z3_ADIRI|nr:unnamed protein product [Adineta ricciae]
MTSTHKHRILRAMLERYIRLITDANDEISFSVASTIAMRIIDFVNLLNNGVFIAHNLADGLVHKWFKTETDVVVTTPFNGTTRTVDEISKLLYNIGL